MKKKEFKLGDVVQDNITGAKGTVITVVTSLTGCTDYIIASKETKDKKSDSYWVTEGKLISKSKEVINTKPFEFNLGDTVKDIITGTVGVIVMAYTHHKGYNNYRCKLLKPKNLEEISTTLLFEEAELVLVKNKNVLGKTKKIINKVEKINNSPISIDRRN